MTATPASVTPPYLRGLVCYADGGDVPRAGEAYRVRIVARTNTPVSHGAGKGRFIHDNLGVAIENGRIALDFAHGDDVTDLIGYADRFEVDTARNELILYGAIVPVVEGDQAWRAVALLMKGIPIEASIAWDLAEGRADALERYTEPFEFMGRRIDADARNPVTVVRAYRLRRCALCGSGLDPHTEVTLYAECVNRRISMADDKPAAPHEKTDGENKPDPTAALAALSAQVETLTAQYAAFGETLAKLSAGADKPENGGGEPDETAVRKQSAELAAKYAKTFGAKLAGEYLAAGLGYTDALEKYAAKLKASDAEAEGVTPPRTDGDSDDHKAGGVTTAADYLEMYSVGRRRK